MRRQCRIWWPKHLSSAEPSSSYTFLFGWFISCASASLDIVVAFSCDEVSLYNCQSSLKDILVETNSSMSVILQDKSVFSLLGQFATCPSSNGQLFSVGMGDYDQRKFSTEGTGGAMNTKGMLRQKNKLCCCGCHKVDGLLEKHRKAAIGSNCWIQIVCDPREICGRNIRFIPKLHHIHWNGQIVSQCDVHIILYETPRYGAHHFSLSFWNSPEKVKTLIKKPKWIDELHQKQPLNYLDAVIQSMNSATASKLVFDRHMGSKRSFAKFSINCMFIALVWQLLAVSMASLSTIFYIFLQFLHRLLSFVSQTWIYITAARVFNTTWINIQIRCGQILHWPIVLQGNDLRSQSCVEYAEKAALHKHSMWSSLAVDVLLGNLIGFSLLFHAESICSWVLNFANDTTNELLRSGCVWLMGVPAGFKLNTELAGVLGMISLNAIQIWSTLWFFVDPFFIYLVKGLAILGILSGMTVPAALVRDLIVLVTLHVSTLHWMISLLYSQQIQALAALWRLFRGRKWNPLRQRLDSYDYTVKQHIVGSLVFTPLLLLLPTTSVFYIFFTMMNSSISLICILIEVTISVIHATPYINIVLWLVRRRRFPAGIWFEIVSYHSASITSPEIVSLDKISSPSKKSQHQENISGVSNVLISILHSNFLTIGQIAMPHYRKVFTGVSRSFFARSAYGILTGKRIASTLGTKLPSTMPWIFMPYKEYWCLCRNSILACMPEHDHHAGQ
ncbi:N-acetylglucosaminyl-phosphatidylinositol biosynthetic protein gpi1 [Melia azedarach]|uniref:N-acetylglucosaminyl-phosphatidylinositol biosynthetic protein gpi1 n=2 Tax=Melia azedarach TaxID=155640 RepID=A0ACC1XL55_MELAZ|nr:N-acetylglucosaminyl-phosphatidylinositol biosynthetic protein gpi1 [Melia azedarach]KAJ4711639.1 N-acetylglucosaminyl-phosphatidylinositol biosynthetic protein gpi1 [Melia azedarach]